jgi:putative tricarboxylic transport membrane protein
MTFDLLNLVPVLLGILIGLISGVLPGVGMISITVIFLPWLWHLTSIQIILWYATVLITEQFIGSVIATYYGVPGQENHWPAVLEGFPMYQRGAGPEAIQAAAFSHIIALLLSMALLLIIGNYSMTLALVFDTKLQFAIIIMVVLGVCALSKDPWYVKIIMLIAGTILGFVGDLNRMYLHYDITIANGINFNDGIPVIPFLVGIFIIPNSLKNHVTNINIIQVEQIKAKFSDFTHWITSLIHSFLGFIFGLTPMLTVDVASNVSYNVQKWWRERTGRYDKDGDVTCLVASESATNSGAVISLMPLLLFGIPITASESLVYSLLNTKGYSFSITNFDKYLLPEILSFLLLVGFINYLISGPLSAYFAKLYEKLSTHATFVLVAIMVGSVLYQGYNLYLLKEYLTVLILSFIIGYSLRKYNFYTLIFCFLMANHTFDIFIRTWAFIKIYTTGT